LIKILLFWTRRFDQTHDVAVKYWLEQHVPLVKKCFGDKLRRYVTNVGLESNYSGWSPTEAPPYDGVSEFWFDLTFEELQQAIADTRDVLWPDERAFTGTYRLMLVEEGIAKDLPGD
jgi:uncharacterized protein (TIGR02118 family)